VRELVNNKSRYMLMNLIAEVFGVALVY